MKGGWAGAALPSTRDPETYVTILEGDLGVSENSYHVVTASTSGIDVTNCLLEGFKIQHGNADGSTASQKSGGGIYINAVSPKISNCIIRDNDADANGAGAFAFETEVPPEFRNCQFISNEMSHASSDDTHGAGVATTWSVTVLNSVFRDNLCYQGGFFCD